MNQDIERAIVFSIPVVSAAISLVMILLDTTRSSNTVNRKIHYSMITVYCLIMLYWSGLVMHSIARDAFHSISACFLFLVQFYSRIPIPDHLYHYGNRRAEAFSGIPFHPSVFDCNYFVIAFIVPFQQRWAAIYDNEANLTSAIIDIMFIACILLSILYSGLSLLRIKSYKRQVADYSADIYRMSLDWLSFIIIFR